MCIICNAGHEGHLAIGFLSHYRDAQEQMRKAAQALLVVKGRVTPEQAKHYDRIHKRMVRLTREWNKIEHQREQHTENKNA